jgi:predicted acyl esterase
MTDKSQPEEIMMTPAGGRNRVSAGLLIAAVIVVSGHTTAAREAGYEVTTQTNVMVPMRDGARLATDIYLPAKDGMPVEAKLPVILERRPYNKDE